MTELQRAARQEGVPVGEWVRRAIRAARALQPTADPETKLKAVRRAARHSFPVADIGQMLDEIERGYSQ